MIYNVYYYMYTSNDIKTGSFGVCKMIFPSEGKGGGSRSSGVELTGG